MKNLSATVAAILVSFTAVCASAQSSYTTSFEPPTFSLGDVQGQDGWGYYVNSPTRGAIEVVPAGTPASFGAQTLAIRTRDVNFFGVTNHLFSPTLGSGAGETGSTAGGVVQPNPQSTFQASFWYRTPSAPLISTRSDGRLAELDPSSKGSAEPVANRYAVVRVYNNTNTAAGLVRIEMVTVTNNGNSSVVTVVANNLSWGTWYRLDYLITLVDGTNGVDPNDRFRLEISDTNGAQVGAACGSTWEVGYRGGGFGGSATPRVINGFDFWSTTGPNDTLVGDIDRFSMSAFTPAGGARQATISGSANACAGGTTTLTASTTGGTGSLSAIVWRDASNAVVGGGPTFNAGPGTYTVTANDTSCASATSPPFTVAAYPVLSVAITGTTNVCFGAATTVTASATGGSGSVTGYAWRDASNNVVSNSASLTAGAGTYTVTATDAACGSATGTVTIQTSCQATPVVTWLDPADIVYGTPLSATQLNATANVPGSFVYTPPAGTILNAGPAQVLSTDFTPTDSADYNNVNGTIVHINVLKAPTTTTITNVNPSPSVVGQSVTISVSVTSDAGSPTGTIVITDGVQSCTATTASPQCSIVFTTPGTRTLTASYGGDNNFLSSSSAGVLERVLTAKATVTGAATVCEGGSASLVVTLDGTRPWTLTWSDGLVETVNASPHTRIVTPSVTTTYTITSVRDQAGNGVATGSAVVTVNVVTRPVITVTSPAQLGAPLTLRATPGYTSYQWYRNGVAISGANSADLTIASVNKGDAGNYTVTAQNGGCSSAASAAYSLVPLGSQVDDAVIPVVGMTHGVNGSLFRTTLHLANSTDETIQGEITFINPELPKYSYVLLPHETKFVEDLLPVTFNGLTSANVHGLVGPLPVVIAHVFNDGGALGTSGMIERVIPVESALGPGDRALLITPDDPVEARFTVGMRSLSEGLTVRISRRASGQVIGTFDRTLPPSYLVHEPVFMTVGETTISPDETLTFEVLAGRGVIYGSATDNGTNDPNIQIASKLGRPAGSGHFILPVAGAVDGAFGSHFAAGLQTDNWSDETWVGTLTFHSAGASASPSDPSMLSTVGPRSIIDIRDVVTALRGRGLGSLDVRTASPFRSVLLARVYSIAPEGQGSFVTELVPEEEALVAGQSGVIIASHRPQAVRVNIGVRSLSAGATMTATVRNPAGDILKVTPLTYGPDFFNHTSAQDLLGIALNGDESIVFTINSGSAIIYATWTDNITQDPAMQYAVVQ